MIINDNLYPVNEIFESIQGEGPFAGMNSLFIRFHFCNLRCKWCDTKYTWTEKSDSFKIYSIEEIKKIILISNKNNIIFTGGEPLLFRIDKLIDDNHFFQVETNGIFFPHDTVEQKISENVIIHREKMDYEILNKIMWVVSPKLNNLGVDYDFSKLKVWNGFKNVFLLLKLNYLKNYIFRFLK